MRWSVSEGSHQHSGHLNIKKNWDLSFVDSGNETPAPSFLEYLQGMEIVRDAWLKVRNEERLDESRKQRKVVWIIHAGTLIKCAPEHLRYSSERARQLASMGQAQRLPWAHEGLDGWLRKRQYENLPMDATPDEEDTEDEAEGREDDSSAAWEYETRQVKRKLEMQPSSSSSLGQPRDEAVLSQPVEKTHMHVEQTVRKRCPRSQRSPINQGSLAVFQSIDVTSSA